jgi:hypothetical protein
MKLERLHEYITITVVTLLGVALALYCGSVVGSGRGSQGLMLLGAFAVGTLFIKMKARIWMLIPIFWSYGGQAWAIPLPFAIRDLVTMAVFLFFLALIAVKLVRKKMVYHAMDLCLLCLLIYMVSVFIRNPVGTRAMGFDRVGGKPYFNIILAAMAYWILNRVTMTPRQAKRLPWFMLGGTLVRMILCAIPTYVPATQVFFANFYSEGIKGNPLDPMQIQNQGDSSGMEEGSRIWFLGQGGTFVATFLCSLFRPLTLINPLFFLRFLAFCCTILGVLLSGFRSEFISVLAVFCISSYLRIGITEIIRLASFGVPLLGLVIMLQGNAINLPQPVQRSLCFLPGKWDTNVKEDAAGSSEWRFEMWRTVLSSDKYIQSWWLGDGFGLTQQQLDEAQRLSESTEDTQENHMINGGFHSGPLSSIRFSGILGLIMLYILFYFAALFAYRLIRRSEGTPFYFLTMLIGIPVIYEPFRYTFIYGAFDDTLILIIYSMGMLKALSNSMNEPEQVPATIKADLMSGPERPELGRLVPLPGR